MVVHTTLCACGAVNTLRLSPVVDKITPSIVVKCGGCGVNLVMKVEVKP